MFRCCICCTTPNCLIRINYILEVRVIESLFRVVLRSCLAAVILLSLVQLNRSPKKIFIFAGHWARTGCASPGASRVPPGVTQPPPLPPLVYKQTAQLCHGHGWRQISAIGRQMWGPSASFK